MFDAIVSKISNFARLAVRTIDRTIRRSPILATGALIALLFLVW